MGEHVDNDVQSPSCKEGGEGGRSPPGAGRDQQQHRRAPRKERVQPDDHRMPPQGSPEREMGEGVRPTFDRGGNEKDAVRKIGQNRPGD